jgi:hypothetical protein
MRFMRECAGQDWKKEKWGNMKEKETKKENEV